MEFRELYLSHLNLVILSHKNGKINPVHVGANTNYLAMILEGHAIFNIDNRRVEVYPGELLYIPRGRPYVSEWYGEPACTF